jgi:glucosyl-dolichyl phosphate glucuronosyltransferase
VINNTKPSIMETVIISAIICTYNRSKYLPKAIESLIKQDMDYEKYEIIVIDNNSTDNTPEIVRAYQQKHKNLRYIFEPDQGLSIARNRGAAEARGEYVAYLDDDAMADTSWLSSLEYNFHNLTPPPFCIGGKVYLDWEGETPKWFPEQLLPLYTHLDHGDRALLLNERENTLYLQGANMAFRREIFEGGLNGFLSSIGRKGKSLLSGEETEMIKRLVSLTLPVFYVPDAVVRHIVLPERRTRKYLIKRLIADGITQPLMDIREGRLLHKSLKRRILYDFKCLLIALLKSGGNLVLIDQKKALANVIVSARHWGRIITETRLLLKKQCVE